MKPLRRLGVQFQKRSPRFMLSIFVARSALFDHGKANARSQFAHGRRKIDVLILHHEPKNASADAAPETVKRLPLRTDMEGWGFFLMKRTERFEICAGPF